MNAPSVVFFGFILISTCECWLEFLPSCCQQAHRLSDRQKGRKDRRVVHFMYLSFQRVWMEHIGFGFSLYLARFCSCFRSQHLMWMFFASFAFLLDLWPTLSPTCNFLFRLKIRLLPAAASAVLFAVLCRIVRKCAALENYFYFCVYAIS